MHKLTVKCVQPATVATHTASYFIAKGQRIGARNNRETGSTLHRCCYDFTGKTVMCFMHSPIQPRYVVIRCSMARIVNTWYTRRNTLAIKSGFFRENGSFQPSPGFPGPWSSPCSRSIPWVASGRMTMHGRRFLYRLMVKFYNIQYLKIIFFPLYFSYFLKCESLFSGLPIIF